MKSRTMSWFGGVAVGLAVLVGVPQTGWGQAKPDAAALEEAEKLNRMVLYLLHTGQYDDGIPLAEKALSLRKKVLGKDHPAVATSLNNLAMLYDKKGDYPRAEPLLQQALIIWENALGPEHPNVASALDNMATLYQAKGNYAQAEPLMQRALHIRRKTLGPDHLDVAISLNNVGMLYLAKGDYAAAEQFLLGALGIRERALGPNHPDLANALNNLAGLHQEIHDYTQAERLYGRALGILENLLGPEHPLVADSVNNLGALFKDKGDYVRAEVFIQRALLIRKNVLGPNHWYVAQSLNNLAAVHQAQGNYARAAELYLDALRILENRLGLEHPYASNSATNLAALYFAMGDYARSESLLRRALERREKVLGSEHPDVASSLNDLAAVYWERGAYGQAEPLCRRALAIWQKILGPDNPRVAPSLTVLAMVQQMKGHPVEAEALHLQALSILEKTLGREHPDVALALNNLAGFYHVTGNHAWAETLFQRALTIREKVLGEDHPNVAISLSNLSTLHWLLNDINATLLKIERASDIEDRNAARELMVGAAEQRRAYVETLRGDTHSSISLHVQSAPQRDDAKRLAFRTILRRKGLTLDAMSNTFGTLRQRMSPDDQRKFDEWRSLTAQYSALTQRGPDKQPLEAYRDLVQHVNDKRQKLESELSFASKDLQAQLKPVTIEQVQNALPKDAALAELFRYQPFNPKAKGTEARWGKPRFVAYVLHPSSQIDFADLGEAEPIEDAAEAFREALSRDTTDPKPNARRLHQLVMAPIQKLLGNARRIYLSPDGDLNLVPFDALVDETGLYLVESFAITYLSSGRDLIRRGNSSPPREAATVFAGPDYEAGSKLETRPPGQYDPLLYAETEARSIVALMPGTSTREGAAATEAALKKLHAPKFLHISTHGFFEKDLPALHEPPRDPFQIQMRPAPPVENALLRSGLVFAGANRSGLENEDGLLTALEASQLDLWGTKLVVLSACDTGNGQVENGDGVYGLRRAFALAGAETVVMSLWQVEGGATTALMKSYYQGLSAGSGRAEALRQAQIGMLHSRNHSHPYYWASFIVSGDDRSMEGRSVEPTFGKIHPGCGRCAMGTPEETAPWGWLGVLVVAACRSRHRRMAPSSVTPGLCLRPRLGGKGHNFRGSDEHDDERRAIRKSQEADGSERGM